ncbi:Glutaredoxin [Candidatus Accumulibacter aalborgensis]|uniref:Glutaredoxin n=1 Tax=Candidatus Accumulibacter aalborgensis TaxID=1860102 RepID=A0A1A8XMS8_9PROT|nr:glutaredoxin family protein [Candidatus Accumulibacter aalborgensis]SBT05722.1 Glutaredoxin [Candidatus Accumulibacter aalborgensis]
MLNTAPLRFTRVAAVLLLATTAVSAQTTFRWIDPATGGTVISDMPPPPGAKQVMRYTASPAATEPQIPYAVRQASEKFPVVLYTTLGCPLCKPARDLLNGRGVPFSEKVLNSEEDRAEVGRQIGGEVLLPSVSVGRQNVRGFSTAAWNELLDAAGYPAALPSRRKPSAGVVE